MADGKAALPLDESNEEARFLYLCADRLDRAGWPLHALRLREIARRPSTPPTPGHP